jgi:glyoxylase-like metal-dependent hydrolase (beta-lactamase superfamily II)
MRFKRYLRGAAAAWAVTILFGTVAAHAAAPQQKTQAPGYYRFKLGDFEVTVLSDGTFPMKAAEILANPPQQTEAALARAFLRDPIEVSVNAFLINTGSKLVLVDTGAGSLFGPTVGKLMVNLKASGYTPDQVDEIYISHMHLDHVGGLVNDGKIAFPNAVVRAAQLEADHWLSDAHLNAAPKERKEGFENAMKQVNPYVVAGRFKPFGADAALEPGIRAVAAAGHTPGHTAYVVESMGQSLVLWGDTMHVAAVQFPDPSIVIRFDDDATAAAAARKKIFADAAQNDWWVGGAHLPFPGIGHLRTSGTGYIFVPANYTSLSY